MLSFSFRARTLKGKLITDRIEAKTVDEAWSLLEQQGYKAIELLDEEISAIDLDNADSIRRLVFSAKEEQAMRAQKSLLVKIVWKFCRVGNVVIWLPLLIWLLYAVLSGSSRADIVLPADLLIVYLLWFVWANIPGIMYNQALEASVWCRWREVEQWMRRSQRWKDWFKTPFPEHEMLFRLATAEAGQGRLAEALRRVAPLETDSSLASGFYYMRLASVFFARKDFQQAEKCQRKAHSLNPSASNIIDLANTLIRHSGNLAEAQALLDEIDVNKLSPSGKAFFYYGRGVLALETQQPEQACQYLEEVFSLSRNMGLPLVQSLILDTRAYYGLALVAIGEPLLAKKHFEAARPLLVAQGDTELLARCNIANSQ